jgi:elongation factor G
MFTFPIDLRALTQGRGRYSMEFSHYDEVPAHLAQQMVEAHAKEHAAPAP